MSRLRNTRLLYLDHYKVSPYGVDLLLYTEYGQDNLRRSISLEEIDKYRGEILQARADKERAEIEARMDEASAAVGRERQFNRSTRPSELDPPLV
jgi:hypothetical protein